MAYLLPLNTTVRGAEVLVRKNSTGKIVSDHLKGKNSIIGILRFLNCPYEVYTLSLKATYI